MEMGPAKRKEDESVEEYKLRRKLDKMVLKIRMRFGKLFWDSMARGTYRKSNE